ncbi:hypothetical protein JX265_010954 [Neoarthrinium moseri]|uniref:Uncharacterized protein n=1 Tax=Neoarthrinium moseri TaxID=1658444 RepID=A0A9Q0AHX7_9PEZI|nr:uncharacterized protein JN550_009681 [Neoarthrinium moseri]KAI1851720.1 hypothetical protein JX266_003182 [Neoarthrinium moseri]KAI1857924.1 hypothetical protein JX265_010954 [Neoarthrinium moseri]KAI1863361.1 hypothetical protein JN550_009681 [Neoarthrinium moseri]
MEPTQDATSPPAQEGTASNTQPSALERMRTLAAQNPDAMHRAFDSYPWSIDPQFQSLLANGLLSSSELSPPDIALQCRIRRYEERVGIQVDAANYKAYRSQGERPKVDLVPKVLLEQEALHEPDASKRRYAAIANDPATGTPAADGGSGNSQEDSLDESVPSWQRAAPKAALYVNKSGSATGAAAGGPATDSDKEPYPKKFEEIIAFLQTGKEIPGILKIPDTVIDDPSISTTTGRTVPLKPWERQAVSEDK